jgi:hypothetical protein
VPPSGERDDAARLAAEQLYVQFPFDRLYLLAKGRLPHSEPFRGPG